MAGTLSGGSLVALVCGGTAAEHATMINALYGMIRRRLELFINLPYAALDGMALRTRLGELGDSSRASA